MKTAKLLFTFFAAALLAACGGDDDKWYGDYGQIKVPDTRQLDQTVASDGTQASQGVTFTTEGAWTSTIAETTRAGIPGWIAISPDHGDAAGSYTVRITLQPNDTGSDRTATVTITCGTSKITITVTQEASDKPAPEPSGTKLIATIEGFYPDPDSPSGEPMWDSQYTFEYDARNRVTAIKMKSSEEEMAVAFSYPATGTMRVTVTEGDYKGAAYTVTLDEAGRATEVRRDGRSDRWTFAYGTDSHCTEVRQYDIPEPTAYPRSVFGWENGNLTTLTTYDGENGQIPDYSWKFGYTSQINDAQAMNIDLNALLFDVKPGYMPVYETDIAQVLASLGRLGARSANLTTTNMMAEEFSEMYDPDAQTLTYYEIMDTVFEWAQENDGRVTSVACTDNIQLIREYTETGKKEIVEGKGYTKAYVYRIHYAE